MGKAKFIKTQADYQPVLKWIRELRESPEATPKVEKETLTLLLKKCEQHHYPIEAPAPLRNGFPLKRTTKAKA